MSGAEVVARARDAIGARFRMHGRDPAFGLDCVGLVAWALDRRGVPADYALRSGDAERVDGAMRQLGMAPVAEVLPGDVLVLASGAGQLHLGIASESGLIHADAMLRRVVERPGAPPWPRVAAWRAGATTKEE